MYVRHLHSRFPSIRRAVADLLLLLVVALVSISAATAQTADPVVANLGIQAPTLPVTFSRGDVGRSTMRAVRLTSPLTLDGQLDEEVYRTLEPASGFFRVDPTDGQRAVNDTHVWVLFDDDYLYVAFRCLDTRPDVIVANEMRRDNFQIWFGGDNVSFVVDTFYDRRTAFFFQTNPLGAVRDGVALEEGVTNYDWNTVWDARSQRTADGWTAEMAVPFKSLRYLATSGPQVWGFNVLRAVRGQNEVSMLAPPTRAAPSNSFFNLSIAATLFGVEPPGLSRNIELKPYVASDVTTNRVAVPQFSNKVDGDVGFDVKYGITSGLTADFTYNTDFAQVEIDEQQVNLTRFSLFFPEQRDFFLEGRTVFDFGGLGGGGGTPTQSSGDRPILFFSRRIGLENGRPVPIRVGGRLTGRVGRTSIGLLNIQTEETPAAAAAATTFFVTRVKRDIFRRSNIGMLMTRRAPALIGRGSNEMFGLDGNFVLSDTVAINSSYARSFTPGLQGDAESYRALFRYNADRYGLEGERLKIGDAFNAEVGFIQRPRTTLSRVLGRFSPRPKIPGVRKLTAETAYDRYVTSNDVVETALARGTFRIDFENSDQLSVQGRHSSEFVMTPVPFPIVRRITLQPGGYDFNDAQVAYTLGPQRAVSGTFTVTGGQFFSGDYIGAAYSGRIKFSPQLAIEPRLSLDRVDITQRTFTTTLAGSRLTYTITPRMFTSVLMQYNSSLNVLETNARFRWEYQPGSDLFVVYTDGRDTTGPRAAELLNRGFAVKLTRLLRF